MIDYSQLEIWYSPELIKQALSIARESMVYSRTKQSYFTESRQDFWPHVWVVDAICTALQ